MMGLKALVTSYLDHISDNQRNLTTRAKMIQDEKEGWFSFGKLPGYLRSLIDDSVTSNTKAKSDLSSLAVLHKPDSSNSINVCQGFKISILFYYFSDSCNVSAGICGRS